MVAQVGERFDHIDILVNNAGIHDKDAFWKESEEVWQRLYKVNVMGTVLVSQTVVKRMKEEGGGSIIHISSKAAVVGEPGHVAYSASKGAVLSMTRSMAIGPAPFGILVNAVCPGPVKTDLLVENLPTAEEQQSLAAEIPLERLGRPEDIAGIVAYLASDESGWCTGQSFNIDGGMSVLK